MVEKVYFKVKSVGKQEVKTGWFSKENLFCLSGKVRKSGTTFFNKNRVVMIDYATAKEMGFTPSEDELEGYDDFSDWADDNLKNKVLTFKEK